jgi:hypothetical protein
MGAGSLGGLGQVIAPEGNIRKPTTTSHFHARRLADCTSQSHYLLARLTTYLPYLEVDNCL